MLLECRTESEGGTEVLIGFSLANLHYYLLYQEEVRGGDF